MEFILTGEPASGSEFERLGVVTRAFPSPGVLPAAIKLAEKLSNLSGPVVRIAKQAVLTGKYYSRLNSLRASQRCLDRAFLTISVAENTTLDAGMVHEKSLYYSTFSLDDFQEGINSFLQKRKPTFRHS